MYFESCAHIHTHMIERKKDNNDNDDDEKNGVNSKRESPVQQSKNSIKLLYHKRIFPYISLFPSLSPRPPPLNSQL